MPAVFFVLIYLLTSAGLFAIYFYVEVPNAPFQGLLVGGEEDVEPVSTDGATPVENFYGLSIVIAGDGHFSSEGVSFVGRHEDIAWLYFVPAGGYAVRILAAAFWARAIGGYTHLHGLPFAGLFGGVRTSYIAFGARLGIVSRLVRGAACPAWFGLSLYSRFARSRLRESLWLGYGSAEVGYRLVGQYVNCADNTAQGVNGSYQIWNNTAKTFNSFFSH